jgi:hypothetical protein
MDKIIDWFVNVDKFLLWMGSFVGLMILFMVYAAIDNHLDVTACEAKGGMLLTVSGQTHCVRTEGLSDLFIDNYRR